MSSLYCSSGLKLANLDCNFYRKNFLLELLSIYTQRSWGKVYNFYNLLAPSGSFGASKKGQLKNP